MDLMDLMMNQNAYFSLETHIKQLSFVTFRETTAESALVHWDNRQTEVNFEIIMYIVKS